MAMQSINISSYTDPSRYQLSELPKPELGSADDVIIKVHAASINPIDVKRAAGALKMAMRDAFPYRIGYDCAGIVTEVGSDVSRCKVGDEVYTRLPEVSRGSLSEFVVCTEKCIAIKPPSLSFEEAASVPLAGMTALQALRRYKGDLAGKTVFVPAGLSGTGLFACQLAKHVFKAGKVITTVSTAKVDKVGELLGQGTVDQIIDYIESDPRTAIAKGTVDFLFDTTGDAMTHLSLMRPQSGCIVSVATMPSGTELQESPLMELPDSPRLAMPVKMVLDFLDWVRKVRARRYGVEYSYLLLGSSGEDLDALRGYVEDGKVRTVVGDVVKLRDIEGIRRICSVVYSGKGGLGKSVVKVI